MANWIEAAGKPNPGSDAAIDLGCNCAVLDNSHGRGRPGRNGEPEFWIAVGCVVHCPEEKDEGANAG